jgi:hypothetical protein
MTSREKETLQIAIRTISEPRGNWAHGWKMICELAGLDPEQHQPPFRKRTDEDLLQFTKRHEQKTPPRNPN